MASKETVTESPAWRSATDVFKTPKSPKSPLQRRTRRSSIYQRKPAKLDIMKAKTIASPPGVKTRSRRTSIYQKGVGRLLSPSNLPVRTRRTSMYVPSKRNLQAINEFSKVWATPIKLDVQVTLSPIENKMNFTAGKQHVETPNKSSKKSAKKRKADEEQESGKSTRNITESASPQTMHKTPASVKKMAKKSRNSSPGPGISLSDQVMLKRSTRQNQVADQSAIIANKPNKTNTPKTSLKTPRSVKKTPKASSNTRLSLSEQVVIKRSARKRGQEEKSETPENKPKKAGKKRMTPENKPKSPANKPQTPLSLKKSITKSRKGLPLSIKLSTTQVDGSSIKQELLKESPPASLKEARGTSLYNTPKGTPVNKPLEDLIQFSTGPSKLVNKKKRVSVVTTPVTSSPKNDSLKKQYRKTPKPPKHQLDDSLYSTPVSTTKKPRVTALDWTEQPVMKDNTNNPLLGKTRLSPEEMSSVLRSAEKEERERERRLSAGMAGDSENSPSQTTPVFTQKGKRISSKKLSEVVDMNLSNSNVTGLSATSPNSSVELNDTIYTDSRSSRCTIL